jgi:plasmid stabilization system protein ParE
LATVKVLPEAMADLVRLDAFLRTRSPAAADDVSCRLEAALMQLARLPRLGKPIDRPAGHREVYVTRGAATWVLRYRLMEVRERGGRSSWDVVVVRAWHSREQRR